MSLYRDFLPTRQDDLAAWLTNAQMIFSATPEAWGLDTMQATSFATKVTAFKNALQLLSNGQTRSPANVTSKNICKAAVVAEARALVRIVQAFPGTTDIMRQQLQITVPDHHRTPSNPPPVSPNPLVLQMRGRDVLISLIGEKGRGKPAGCAGATIVYYPGTQAPSNAADWRFLMNTTRTREWISFPPSEVSEAVVVTAFWRNARDESGPAAQPITVNLPAGGALPQLAEASAPVKKAA